MRTSQLPLPRGRASVVEVNGAMAHEETNADSRMDRAVFIIEIVLQEVGSVKPLAFAVFSDTVDS